MGSEKDRLVQAIAEAAFEAEQQIKLSFAAADESDIDDIRDVLDIVKMSAYAEGGRDALVLLSRKMDIHRDVAVAVGDRRLIEAIRQIGEQQQ